MTDELERRVTCYMDGIDWQHELGEASDGTKLYPSAFSLRVHQKCVVEGGCGIVEVEVRLIRWVEEQNLKYGEVEHD